MRLANGADPRRPPFAGFKWQWATLQPTEGLNDPAVFKGVLGALANNEGKHPSDLNLLADLERVQDEVDTNVSLARQADRNLIRNSGQYWKFAGVLADTSPIRLTTLGRAYARKDLTALQFATQVVLERELPSVFQPARVQRSWAAAGLSVRPLLLLLQIAASLQTTSRDEGYLTLDEAVLIIQPLSGHKAELQEYADAILDFRAGELEPDKWESPLNGANDRRMANEFFLFLANYGFMTLRFEGSQKRYWLSTEGALVPSASTVRPAFAPVHEAEVDDLVGEIDRARQLVSILSRPGQAKFRRDVLKASSGVCLVTGTKTTSVLEAAHIRPVSRGGTDDKSNGLCLRSDVHTLFDSGNLSIWSDGTLRMARSTALDPTYATLPESVELPTYVSRSSLRWRWNYE
ncbi:HNH endonuclease [Marisediminicola sp. LYQ134]|uniref:HNH endonuclease n=1 Tax=Marisediminicola sp. LYQ134 TaxID=3391061 RepID=UPI003983D679